MAVAADGVMHLAFTTISASTDFAVACQADLHVVATSGAALDGTGKPFV